MEGPLSKQDNFWLNFPAILKFDIEQPTWYALDLKEYSEELYLISSRPSN